MKKGVSLVSLIIVIIIMIILAGVVVFSGMSSSETITIQTFAIELLDIQNAVDAYYYRYNVYPTGNEYVLDTTTIKSVSQFSNETITNNKINLRVIDLTVIGINDTEFGTGNGKDIYVISEQTGIVYYIQGIVYENETYYTLTDRLYEITEIKDNDLVSGQDIKEYDVIFTPSTTQYTNEPITVTIKLPRQANITSITTTNNKSVSQETVQGLYKQIQINETGEDRTGNYKITINYTYGTATKTAEYEVKNYNADVPIVTYTEEISGNIKTVKLTVNNNGATIKNIKYEEKLISETEHFNNYGKEVKGYEIKIEKDTPCSVGIETAAGISQIIYVIPESWKQNVTNIVNGVPIPKGFVASSATGENTKKGGLVIYEGSSAVTDSNVEQAKRGRNQYVWVPVDDFSKFVRQDYSDKTGQYYTKVEISNVFGTGYWEAVIDKKTNMPLLNQDLAYMTTTTISEIIEMYQSVKEYSGFYIARYEAGIDTQRMSNDGKLETSVYSRMGKIPYTYVPWTNEYNLSSDTGGVVEVSRSLYPKTNGNYGVISTLTYGVQWDRTLEWWLEVGAKNGKGDVITNVINSYGYGNYRDSKIAIGDLNEGAKYAVYSDSKLAEYKDDIADVTKDDKTSWALSTGALNTTSVNNIYDMSGNMWEWTMEGDGSRSRTPRGNALNGGSSGGVYTRGGYFGTYAFDIISFRPSLYIKLK